MAKPILWLSSAEELDDEYDPLLGRAVRDEPLAEAPRPAPILNPERSVFDEGPFDAPSPPEEAAPAHPVQEQLSPAFTDAEVSRDDDTLATAQGADDAPELPEVPPLTHAEDTSEVEASFEDWPQNNQDDSQHPSVVFSVEPLEAEALTEPVEDRQAELPLFSSAQIDRAEEANVEPAPTAEMAVAAFDEVFKETVAPEPQQEHDPEPALIESVQTEAIEVFYAAPEASIAKAEPLSKPDSAENPPVPPSSIASIFNARGFWGAQRSQTSTVSDEVEAALLQTEPDRQATAERVEEPQEPQEPQEPEPSAPFENSDDGQDGAEKFKPGILSTSHGTTQARPLGLARKKPEPVIARKVSRNPGKVKRRRSLKVQVAGFVGVIFLGLSLFLSLISMAAPLGYPFDAVASYRWYWAILAAVAAGAWAYGKGRLTVVAALLVVLMNLAVTVPASGKAPQGGKVSSAVVAWANVSGNQQALTKVLTEADRRKVGLVMIAEAPASILQPPVGWELLEAPNLSDVTAITVLAKSDWRAATVPGEPTIARPVAGDLTIIGVHPRDPVLSRRRTPARDALINRAGARAGIQEGPTVVIGDFSAAPWDIAMKQFRELGAVERVRCGGWMGSTVSQWFGLVGVAVDHAYVRDVKVVQCKLGGALAGGHHKPLYLYLAPKEPAK